MEQSQVPPMGAHKASQKDAAVVDDLLKDRAGSHHPAHLWVDFFGKFPLTLVLSLLASPLPNLPSPFISLRNK